MELGFLKKIAYLFAMVRGQTQNAGAPIQSKQIPNQGILEAGEFSQH